MEVFGSRARNVHLLQSSLASNKDAHYAVPGGTESMTSSSMLLASMRHLNVLGVISMVHLSNCGKAQRVFECHIAEGE